jgi:hypothetical protein
MKLSEKLEQVIAPWTTKLVFRGLDLSTLNSGRYLQINRGMFGQQND